MNRYIKPFLGLSFLLLLPIFSSAEDIDLYVGNSAQRIGGKPKVLIILDNSGSMNTSETVKTPYDPNTTYPAVGGNHSLSDDFIYYTKGAGVDNSSLVPDGPSERRRFLSAINSCDTAKQKLNSIGFYTGYIREYAFQGNSGSWQEIPDNNGANIEVIDCLDDILLNNPTNAGIKKTNGTIVSLSDGYPIDGEGTKQLPVYYTNSIGASNTNMGSGEVVTLYTDNYLRWLKNTNIATVPIDRITIAKTNIVNLIESAPGVDFGLQVFNINAFNENERDGGRVVFGIQDMNLVARNRLTDIIKNEVDGETNTPLCETLFEAGRYFSGSKVVYGKADSKPNYYNYTPNTPPRDISIESGSNYISPYSGCTSDIYVILITDGVPTVDHAADIKIAALPGIGPKEGGNYLAALAGWMHTNDLNTNIAGDQTSTMYTIGFSNGAADAAPLLTETARLGGGKYYDSSDPSRLLASLQSALVEILEVNGTFTSPSVASNNFDRTETLDSVYYAMFLPDRGPRWQGNLKKLKVTNGGLVDRTGASAIGADGNILPGAKTFWSTGAADGDKVQNGGVASKLRGKTNRKILSDLGTEDALVTFTRAHAETSYGSTTALATELDVSEAEIDATLKWAWGTDVDDVDSDGSITDIRYDIFGDPLHSKPLVVNYGGTEANQDIRIIVGTNAGVLHMFDDAGDTVDESWAFMPKEFFHNIKGLRSNFTSADKIYGIDGSATAYILDVNGDGSVNKADGDKAWIFFGLRRGGSSYYGIDITSPDSPVLMWHINSSSSGFSELGQSWSQPKIGYSKANVDASGNPLPVLFFGGGYATSKDTAGVGSDDLIGRGVYMVDAKTGVLKWSLTPDTQSDTNTIFSGKDSIPSRIAILDSDSDGLVDRLYTGDTGGNVWRVDMPGSASNSTTQPWTAIKLASLGGNTDLTDRRFFSAPVIARALITETLQKTTIAADGTQTVTIDQYDKPYDAILLGSGDRSTPTATDTADKYFMIKDELIVTQSLVGTDIPAVVLDGDLYDYTNNPFGQTLTDAQKITLQAAVTAKKGWFISFVGSGEKSTASGDVVAGVAYFGSFTPASSQQTNDCTLLEGAATLYAVDLSLGTTIYDWRKLVIGFNPPGEPTFVTIPHVPVITDPPVDPNAPPAKHDFAIIAPDVIVLCDATQNCSGVKIQTMRTYLYVTEP